PHDESSVYVRQTLLDRRVIATLGAKAGIIPSSSLPGLSLVRRVATRRGGLRAGSPPLAPAFAVVADYQMAKFLFRGVLTAARALGRSVGQGDVKQVRIGPIQPQSVRLPTGSQVG